MQERLFSRWTFLNGLVAAGLVGTVARSFGTDSATKGMGTIDPDLAVFLSDLHVNGARYSKKDPTRLVSSFQAERLRMAVDEILRRDPLPSKVICFGDFAFSNGQLADYELAKKILRLLFDVGMELPVGMGNHDWRDDFQKCFPDYKARTLVQGRIVSKVEFRHADFYMLDTFLQV